MGESRLRLDVQNSIDGVIHRVSISARRRVKDLLQNVIDRTECRELTTLAVVRGETEARLGREDVLGEALDQTETRLKAIAEPLELARHCPRSEPLAIADRTGREKLVPECPHWVSFSVVRVTVGSRLPARMRVCEGHSGHPVQIQSFSRAFSR